MSRPLAAVALLAAALAAPARADDDDPGRLLHGEAAISVLNRYVARGFQYGHAPVVQPELTLGARGFSAHVWGNVDTRGRATKNYAPREAGELSLNEVDVTLAFERELGPVTASAGWSWYRTRYAERTQEVFASASVALPVTPTLAVHQDVAAFPGTYVSLDLAREIALPFGGLELGASAGAMLGASEAWRTTDPATGAPGAMYRALHDGAVRAVLGVPVGRGLTAVASLQVAFPLSSDAAREGYSPAGAIDPVAVWGGALRWELQP
jgi:hypothetical protein